MGMRLYCDMCNKIIGDGAPFYSQYSYECKEGSLRYHDTHPWKITLCEECYGKYEEFVEHNGEWMHIEYCRKQIEDPIQSFETYIDNLLCNNPTIAQDELDALGSKLHKVVCDMLGEEARECQCEKSC